jgi:nucleoside triphosphatase
LNHPELTVSAVIFNKADQILLCKSHKWDNKYIIPGGHVELGEKLEDALKREILEETALEIHSIKLIGIKECFYSNNYYKNRHFIFIDYICKTETANVVLNDEAEDYIWVSLENVDKYDLGGFTGSLINKIADDKDSSDKEEIYYNY